MVEALVEVVVAAVAQETQAQAEVLAEIWMASEEVLVEGTAVMAVVAHPLLMPTVMTVPLRTRQAQAARLLAPPKTWWLH